MTEPSVLLVLSNSTGGIGTHVAALARACADAGQRVTVCGPAGTGALFDFNDAATFVPLPVGLPMLANRSQCRALRALAGQHQVVHAHGLQAGVVTSLVVKGVPVVVTWHNAPLSRGPRRALHVLLERIAARRVAVTVGASPDLVLRAERAGSGDARYVPVAPPPPGPPSADVGQLRRQLGVGDRPVVLAVGRLHRQKRLDVLVSAAALWQQRSPVPVVLVAGDGPERTSLQAAISALGVDVRLLGRRDDIADLLSVSDVVVLPSSWEARPLVAQEALAAGRALVTTAAGGTAELVGDAAVLVPVGDVAALATAVAALLDDPMRRQDLESRAVARAAQWPTATEVGERLMAVYAELVAKS